MYEERVQENWKHIINTDKKPFIYIISLCVLKIPNPYTMYTFNNFSLYLTTYGWIMCIQYLTYEMNRCLLIIFHFPPLRYHVSKDLAFVSSSKKKKPNPDDLKKVLPPLRPSHKFIKRCLLSELNNHIIMCIYIYIYIYVYMYPYHIRYIWNFIILHYTTWKWDFVFWKETLYFISLLSLSQYFIITALWCLKTHKH